MKDGTLVALDAGQDMDRVDLKDAFANQSEVMVYLAVPKLRLGAVNVASEAGQNRYLDVPLSFQDESRGGNDQQLQFRVLNARLLLSTQETAGYELLPIARVQRAGEQEATPRVDENYFPPMLAVDAWPPLGRDIFRAVYDLIGDAIKVLTEQVQSRGMMLSAHDPDDLNRLLMLSELNAASCTLAVLAFASGVHPLLAYTELCRIVGQLSIFGPDRQPPEIPRYDHDDLARIFRYIYEQIKALLKAIPKPEYQRRDFVGDGKGMRVTIEKEWLGNEWQWFVGVSRGALSEHDCQTLLAPGALNWKLGSARQVDTLFQYGMEGLHLTPLAQAPRALPVSPEWLYYQVTRDNAAWKDVLEDQTLAMRLSLVLIKNRDKLPGQKVIEVSAGARQATLQFALFAVRTTRPRR
jgi:type VI secretion system protein ImpJ